MSDGRAQAIKDIEVVGHPKPDRRDMYWKAMGIDGMKFG